MVVDYQLIDKEAVASLSFPKQEVLNDAQEVL